MRESTFTSLLLKHLRAALPDCYIVKHSNVYTSGVPDFSVSRGSLTHWFEVKINPNRPTKIQTHYLAKLGEGGHLIVYFAHNNLVMDASYQLTLYQLVDVIVELMK
jgi:hypothetical protein